MYCQNCGQEIEDESKFCKYCGTETHRKPITKNIKHHFSCFFAKIKNLKIFQKEFYSNNRKIMLISTSIVIAFMTLLLLLYFLIPFLFVEISILKFNNKKYDIAIEWCNRAIKINSRYANAYYNRANAKSEIFDIESAREDYNKAIELKPHNAEYYFARGNCSSSYCNQALNDFNVAIKLNSKKSKYYVKRAKANSCLGNYTEAFADINTAIKLKSKDAKIYYERSNIYETIEKYKEANEDLNKAIELAPKEAIYYSARGRIKAKLWDNNGALKDFNKAITLEPDNTLFYANRGLFKATQLKNFKEGIEDFNKAIELNSVDSLLYQSRSTLKYLQNDNNGAMKDINIAIDLANNDKDKASAYHFRGDIKYKKRNYSGATDDSLKAYTLNPSQEYFQSYMNSSYNSVMSIMPNFYY